MIELSKVVGTVKSVALAQRSGDPEEARATRKIVLVLQVGEHLDELEVPFPGGSIMAKAVAVAEAPGCQIASKIGERPVLVTLYEPQQREPVLGPLPLIASAPRLTIGRSALEATLMLTVTGLVPTGELTTLDSLFQGDLRVSIVPAQEDLADRLGASSSSGITSMTVSVGGEKVVTMTGDVLGKLKQAGRRLAREQGLDDPYADD